MGVQKIEPAYNTSFALEGQVYFQRTIYYTHGQD